MAGDLFHCPGNGRVLFQCLCAVSQVPVEETDLYVNFFSNRNQCPVCFGAWLYDGDGGQSDLLEPALLKMSNLMHYMLYDSDEEKVSLHKEV